MAVLVLDPLFEQWVRDERERTSPKNRDEVRDRLLHILPLIDNEQQHIVSVMSFAFGTTLRDRPAADIMAGCNVSDRIEGWLTNYRIPDVAVYLSTTKAKDCGTHWVGGPDLAVEIASPGEDPRQKLDFYAKVNTREVLIVDREPWALELYQLQGGMLVLIGTSDAATSAVLASSVLPLTFTLRPATPRPTIRIAHTAKSEEWAA